MICYRYGSQADHRPIGRCASSANEYHMPAPHHPHPSTVWEQHQLGAAEALHQSVTRIASAPDPLPPRWQPTPAQHHQMQMSHLPQSRLSASSEPNLMGPPPQSHPWPAQVDAEARSRINYHLSSLFPSEQVQAAMSMLPDETNPQKICALILSMFPKP